MTQQFPTNPTLNGEYLVGDVWFKCIAVTPAPIFQRLEGLNTVLNVDGQTLKFQNGLLTDVS